MACLKYELQVKKFPISSKMKADLIVLLEYPLQKKMAEYKQALFQWQL
jgi:hypothetical protein